MCAAVLGVRKKSKTLIVLEVGANAMKIVSVNLLLALRNQEMVLLVRLKMTLLSATRVTTSV